MPDPKDNSEATVEEPAVTTVEEALPGFYVTASDGALLGRYETEVDAQCFIDGQLTPLGLSGTITEVK